MSTFIAIIFPILVAVIILWAVSTVLSEDSIGPFKALWWRTKENAVVVKSGNPHPWTHRSLGKDITNRVVSLGAPAPPKGAKYVYFETLVLQEGHFNTLTSTYKNQLTLIIGKDVYRVEVKVGGNVEEKMADAAHRVYEQASGKIAELENSRRLAEFIDGEKNDMPLIGKKSDWVED